MGPLPTCHWTLATPESASLPVTATSYGLLTGPDGCVVVLVGASASTWTFSTWGAERLPATSRARVRSWYSPVVVKGTMLPEGPCSQGPLSICHSTRSIPDTASVALTSTWAAGTQSSGASVRSVGAVVSILTVCGAQPDSLPATSRTSVWTVCEPSAEIVNWPCGDAVIGGAAVDEPLDLVDARVGVGALDGHVDRGGPPAGRQRGRVGRRDGVDADDVVGPVGDVAGDVDGARADQVRAVRRERHVGAVRAVLRRARRRGSTPRGRRPR